MSGFCSSCEKEIPNAHDKNCPWCEGAFVILDGTNRSKCPNCLGILDDDSDSFCCDCGQKITKKIFVPFKKSQGEGQGTIHAIGGVESGAVKSEANPSGKDKNKFNPAFLGLPTWLSKSETSGLLISMAIMLALPFLYLLIAYGTPSPCGALRKELRRSLNRRIIEEASRPSSNVYEEAGRNWGAALGVSLGGPLIDNIVEPLGPIQCVNALVRCKMLGQDPFRAAQLK